MAASMTETKAGPARGTGVHDGWKKTKSMWKVEIKEKREPGEGNWKSSFKNRMRPSTIICRHLTLQYSK